MPSYRQLSRGTERAVGDALLGFGWGIQREHKRVMLWHWRDNGVFKAFVMADPAGKSGVVMSANGQDALNVAKPIIDTAIGTDSLAFAWLK